MRREKKKSLKKSSPKQSVGLAPKKAKHPVNDQKKKTREIENNGKKRRIVFAFFPSTPPSVKTFGGSG